MDSDRYKQALAKELDASVEGLGLRASEMPVPVQPWAKRKPEPVAVEAAAEPSDAQPAATRGAQLARPEHKSHSKLFPGVDPNISRWDVD